MTMADAQTTVTRLHRDLREAAATMTAEQVRYMVDAYYTIQEDRKRTKNQVRASKSEPHSLLAWFADNSAYLETQIKVALDRYSDAQPIGAWMKSLYGIGPVIAAGILAHVDIEVAVTAGHIYRFAGLDPTVKWEKGKKRPWNARLKTLCWKLGQSFMKFSNEDECFYGQLYRKRKEQEVERNEAGANAELCKQILASKNFNKDTDAFRHYSAGKLPPAHLDARARRWVVKLFLSHLQELWFFQHHGRKAPVPYAMAHLGHAHYIAPPNSHLIKGWDNSHRN